MIWVTSDTHHSHKNICKGQSLWEDKGGCRDFNTIEEMNKAIVDNINAVVKEDDELYHLGDWSFGGIENIWNFRKQIKCKNIHLILGNHDHHIERNSQIRVGEREYLDFLEIPTDVYKNFGGMSHVNTQDLFSSVSHYKEVKINGRRFVMMHYAMGVWNDSHRGSIMLYGHSHGTLDALKPEFADPTWIGDSYYIKNARTMDVGIDTHPQFRPYSITEIIDIMKEKNVLLVDHHDGNTN